MDRKKVIKALEDFNENRICLPHLIPWDEIADAVALLKEREAVEPILKREGRNKAYNDYACPACGQEIVYEQKYCSECGKPVSWKGGEVGWLT